MNIYSYRGSKFARPAVAAVLLSALLLLSAGCSQQGNFTRQNYETLYIGQPTHDVLRAMGKPNAQTENRWTYEQAMPYCRAEVFFNDGKVARTAWSMDKPSPASTPNRP